MNLSNLSIKRPVATIMLLLIVVVLGVFSVMSIPLDLMPSIELPVAMVMTTYSNSSPEEVESMVTEPLESALAAVEGLETLISYSMEGTSIVAVQFDMDTDMDFATLDMREKIALVADYLPDAASEPMVMKMDMNSMPVVQLYISSEEMTLAELNEKVENNIVPYFERASGVASVSVSGGVEEEVAIKFSQEELNLYGLTLSTVAQMLAAENINLPSGSIDRGASEVVVRTIGEFDNADDIANLPITIADRSIVRLGDIATVTQGYQEQESITRIDGKTAIGVMISKQSDANTVDVCDNVEEVMASLEASNPDMTFTIGSNQADYIKASVSSVVQSALEGGLLAIIVVFLFLRNMRTTMIIEVSIPTSLLAAFSVMKLLDITLNLVTLCAITIVVGMLVDNSIVVLENIFRRRQEMGDAMEAARVGSTEIFTAIVMSTLTTIMVFIPIAMSDGIASMMFKEFCWTIVIALVASLIVSVTVIPMLCSRIMRGTVSTEYIRIGDRRYKYKLINKFGDFIENVKFKYEKGIRWALEKRKKVIISCMLIFFISLGFIMTVGFELLPESDEGSISISAEFPYGTPLEKKDVVMSQIEDYVLTVPEVEHISMSTDSISSMSTSNSATVTITLVDRSDRKRSSEEVASELREAFADITDADIEAEASSSVMGMFGSSDVSLMIKGQDRETLESIGYDLVDTVKALDCVESASLDITEGNPEIKVKIDRTTASYYGITAYQLAGSLSSAISGTTATTLTVDGTDIDVNLSLNEEAASSVESMKQIMITGSYGTSVPVGQIATFEYDNAPSLIQRDNQTNYITLNVDVAGNSATNGSSEVIRAVNSYMFPDGYYIEESGVYDQMMEAFGSLFKALIIAIALVFLLLAAQFESVTLAFVVIMAVPFAMSGAFLMMFLTGTSLSMTSFLGLIILVGIVVNNSILLVEFIKQNEETLGIKEALVQAGMMRLRPILMSCTTTVVGMIPLSLGLGEGGEMLAPMAISIIGGLIASTLVTLFLIPILYDIINDRKNKKKLKQEEKAAHTAELEAMWAKEDALVE